jgi:hypothetical protein
VAFSAARSVVEEKKTELLILKNRATSAEIAFVIAVVVVVFVDGLHIRGFDGFLVRSLEGKSG